MSDAEDKLRIRSDSGSRLFLLDFWPSRFGQPWLMAKTMRTRAKIAAERIEHFIKTKGAE